jgi:hypothetical protein
VNNPALGLAVNGTGVVGVFDPKIGLIFKAGLQQSNNEATNLSNSIYSLMEADYVARPPGLGEGNYRVWFRNDNSTERNRTAIGLSLDQKLTPIFGLFGRFGSAQAESGRDHFYSLGFQFQNGLVMSPLDVWGIGYAQTDLETRDHEKLVEGYYNFRLSEKLRLSLRACHQRRAVPVGHAYHGQQGQLLPLTVMRALYACAIVLAAVGPAHAQDVRQRTRPADGPSTTTDPARARFRTGVKRPEGTSVNESQALDLTLTLSAVSARPVQNWIRTAGTIDESGKILTASVSRSEAALIKVGQRVRAFPPSSKSSMYQAWITRVAPQGAGVTVEASLASTGRQNSPHYVMEIVVERGPFLSVPNEAIIEEGDRRIVYVQRAGRYAPQEVHTGIQGELYTQVLDGLSEGDQVVTFGSFFIDAEHKLKATDQGSTTDDHRHH